MTRPVSIRAITYFIGIAVITLAAAVGGSFADVPVHVAVPVEQQQPSVL